MAKPPTRRYECCLNLEFVIILSDTIECVCACHFQGKGDMSMECMATCHQYAYVYPVARACGGSRQDVGTEGAGAVLEHVPYYLEFLVWHMTCGGDGILEKNCTQFCVQLK